MSMALRTDTEASPPMGDGHGDWERFQDPSTGYPYWYNHSTGQSVWDNASASPEQQQQQQQQQQTDTPHYATVPPPEGHSKPGHGEENAWTATEQPASIASGEAGRVNPHAPAAHAGTRTEREASSPTPPDPVSGDELDEVDDDGAIDDHMILGQDRWRTGGGQAGHRAALDPDEHRQKVDAEARESRAVEAYDKVVEETAPIMTWYSRLFLFHACACEAPAACLEGITRGMLYAFGAMYFAVVAVLVSAIDNHTPQADTSTASATQARGRSSGGQGDSDSLSSLMWGRAFSWAREAALMLAASLSLLLPCSACAIYTDFDVDADRWDIRPLPTVLGNVDPRRFLVFSLGQASDAQNVPGNLEAQARQTAPDAGCMDSWRGEILHPIHGSLVAWVTGHTPAGPTKPAYTEYENVPLDTFSAGDSSEEGDVEMAAATKTHNSHHPASSAPGAVGRGWDQDRDQDWDHEDDDTEGEVYYSNQDPPAAQASSPGAGGITGEWPGSPSHYS